MPRHPLGNAGICRVGTEHVAADDPQVGDCRKQGTTLKCFGSVDTHLMAHHPSRDEGKKDIEGNLCTKAPGLPEVVEQVVGVDLRDEQVTEDRFARGITCCEQKYCG